MNESTAMNRRQRKLYVYDTARRQVVGIHWIDGVRARVRLRTFAEEGLTVPMVTTWRSRTPKERREHCPHPRKLCDCRTTLALLWEKQDSALRDADTTRRVDAQRISHHFDLWLEAIEGTKAAGTYENARLTRDQYLEIVGDHPLWSRDPESNIRRYDFDRAQRFVTGLKRRKRPIAPNTIRLRLRTLRSFLFWLSAEARRKLDAVPSRNDWHALLPKREKRQHRTLTDTQAEQVFAILYDREANAPTEERKRLSHLHLRFAMVALGTGRRLGEIWSRQWADFDLDAGILRITHRPEIGFTVKNQTEAIAHLPSTLTTYLRTVREQYPEEVWLFDAADEEGEHHAAFGRYSLTRTMRRLYDKLGVDKAVKPTHQYRSRYISRLFEQGVDLETIRLSVGHADQTTTASYLEQPDAQVRNAVNEYDTSMSRLINRPRLKVVDGGNS